jgi:hypothetical protein
MRYAVHFYCFYRWEIFIMMTFNYYGMTFEVSEDSFEGRLLALNEGVEAYNKAIAQGVAYEELPHMDYQKFFNLMDEAEVLGRDDIRSAVWRLYGALEYAENQAYRNRYLGEFLEYFKDGMPSDEVIENACLSDWHKDLFGYRPRGDRWAVLVELAQAREE